MLTTGLHRDVQDIINQALSRGWAGRRTSKGHVMLRHPNGGTVTIPGTPSGNRRSIQNSKADIRRVERASA